MLQVVDFPFVPVTTIDLKTLFVKKKRSMSVIILFLFLYNNFLYLFLIRLIPGLKTI